MVKRKERIFGQIMLVCDVATLIASFVLAYLLRDYLDNPLRESMLQRRHGPIFPFSSYAWILWVILPTWVISLRRFELYGSRTYESGSRIFTSLLKAQVLGGLTLLSILYLTTKLNISRLLLEVFLVVSFGMLLTVKIAVIQTLSQLARRRRAREHWKVLLVGDLAHADPYFQLLQQHPHWGIQVIGVISPTFAEAANANGRSTGPGHLNGQANGTSNGTHANHANGWAEALGEYSADEVVAVCSWEEAPGLQSLAEVCAERGVIFRTMIKLPQTTIGGYQVEDLGKGTYLISLETVPHEVIPLLIKRMIDVVGAISGLLLCMLVLPFYAWRLRRESPGPVFFRQQRRGQNGRVFTLYKFRTMYPDAEARLEGLMDQNEMHGLLFKMKDDPRITPTGRFMRRTHLDELPQFWNVLKGDMSLVGTRPPTTNEVAQYEQHHHRRLSFRPGITGNWQLAGNTKVNNFEEVVRLDCEYIDNWSLWQDIQIIVKTSFKMIRHEGW